MGFNVFTIKPNFQIKSIVTRLDAFIISFFEVFVFGRDCFDRKSKTVKTLTIACLLTKILTGG